MKKVSVFWRIWSKLFPPKWVPLEPDENGTFHIHLGD